MQISKKDGNNRTNRKVNFPHLVKASKNTLQNTDKNNIMKKRPMFRNFESSKVKPRKIKQLEIITPDTKRKTVDS